MVAVEVEGDRVSTTVRTPLASRTLSYQLCRQVENVTDQGTADLFPQFRSGSLVSFCRRAGNALLCRARDSSSGSSFRYSFTFHKDRLIVTRNFVNKNIGREKLLEFLKIVLVLITISQSISETRKYYQKVSDNVVL